MKLPKDPVDLLPRAVILCVLALGGFGVHAAGPGPCPDPADVEPAQLAGAWRAQLPGQWEESSLELGPHPEYARSLFGTLYRGAARSQVAADFDAGEFTLEESADGVRIDAVWIGQAVEGSCGREIRGLWRASSQETGRPFVLRRMTGR